MKRINIVIFLLSFWGNLNVGATDNYLPGSRFAAMANASVMLPDIWSTFHNQAGLAYLNRINFSFHYENRFIVPEFGLKAVALSIPTKPGAFGLSFSYFGYSKYHETKTGLAYSKLFGTKFSAGVQINYHTVFISEQYGKSYAISVEGGIMYQPVENLFIGAHIFNPSRSKFNTPDGDEFLPVSFRFGAGYRLINKIMLAFEAQKESDLPPLWKLGIEFEALDNLYLRGGLGSYPTSGSFGIGYEIVGLRADIAFSFHPQLGFSPHFTFTYAFR